METPSDCKYTKEHEWIKVEGEFGTIGITFYAQKQLTDVVFVELPDKGKKVEQSKGLCVVESVKSVSDVYAPVSGEVTERNEKLKTNPELVNSEPYGEGWLCKLKIRNKKELDNLMSAEQYDNYLKSGAKH